MKFGGIVAIVVTCLIYGAGVSHAGVQLSLTAPGVDLDNLPLGVPTTIHVQLSGLDVGQELDALAATVVYDGVLLGVPLISSGPIVPNPLDNPLDFLTSKQSGLADATFMTFGTEPSDQIVSEGTFFTFDVTPLVYGSGSLSFDFVDATQFNPNDPFDPILLYPVAGPNLTFTSPITLGDANVDGVVNDADTTILAANWLTTGATWEQGDFNGDTVVNDLDATLLAANWTSFTPGDANEDGVVNDADAAILSANWLTTGATWGQGDFNNDTIVNDLDAMLLAANWTSSSASAAVPEPASSALLMVVVAGLCWRWPARMHH